MFFITTLQSNLPCGFKINELKLSLWDTFNETFLFLQVFSLMQGPVMLEVKYFVVTQQHSHYRKYAFFLLFLHWSFPLYFCSPIILHFLHPLFSLFFTIFVQEFQRGTKRNLVVIKIPHDIQEAKLSLNVYKYIYGTT